MANILQYFVNIQRIISCIVTAIATGNRKGELDILFYVSYRKYVNINGQFNIYFFLMIILIKLPENVEIHLL